MNSSAVKNQRVPSTPAPQAAPLAASFDALRLPDPLRRAVQDLGFQIPTPIQAEAIPPGLEGRDLIACAMTGSGKTAAFLLPALARLGASPARAGAGPRLLVLSPTRELAAQTTEQFQKLARHTRMRGSAVYGGVGMNPQERAFRTGVEAIIATPGRLLDHLSHSYASLGRVEILVLDEADRMLDMGFLPDIRRILAQLPRDRQNLMFSATMPQGIAVLAREILSRPVQIAIDRVSKPASGVTQSIYMVREEAKTALLLELLRRDTIHNAIVFTRTKHRANRLADKLEKAGVSCDRIHGNRSQSQRTDALARFKNGRLRVLVATDIAARGIDVEALSHVVNFDVPNVPDDYIHRVGRTARAEATGDAWTFVSDAERGELHAIERVVGKRLPRLVLEGFDYAQKSVERFEVPVAERIAEIRARKSDERARARANAERRARQGGSAAGTAATATRGGSQGAHRGNAHAPVTAGGRGTTTARPRTWSRGGETTTGRPAGHSSAPHSRASHSGAGAGTGASGAGAPRPFDPRGARGARGADSRRSPARPSRRPSR